MNQREQVQHRLDNEDWLKVLEGVKSEKSYFVGGGLFVDFEEGPFGFHLNGTLVEFRTGLERMLCTAEHRKLFEIYKDHKGETEYYRNNWAVFMERRLPDCPTCA